MNSTYCTCLSIECLYMSHYIIKFVMIIWLASFLVSCSQPIYFPLVEQKRDGLAMRDYLFPIRFFNPHQMEWYCVINIHLLSQVPESIPEGILITQLVVCICPQYFQP